MNVLYIGKYPPIEGGTAAAAYWRIKKLRRFGINFEVITCFSLNDEYVIKPFVPRQHLHLINEKTAWHIPYSQLYSERLISEGLKLSEQINFDLIEGCYLFPYGFGAYVIAKILNKPLIIRHAGSDLYRLSKTGDFNGLMLDMINSAKLIVTYKECVKRWSALGAHSNLYITSRYVPDPSVFFSEGSHLDAVFLGKITDRWNRSQFDYYHSKLKKAGDISCIKVYSSERAIKEFENYFNDKGYNVIGNPFVMPSKVPEILKSAKYLLISEPPKEIPECSNCLVEGLMSGCSIIRSDKNFKYIPEMNFEKYLREQLEIYERV